MSPSGGLLAWSQDLDGSEEYELRIRNLVTGVNLDDRIGEYAFADAEGIRSAPYATLKKDYSSWWNANIDTILTAHLATKRIVRNNQIEIKVTA